ncbi:MAG: spermidine/putrescine ABC transporter substrate-binding protein, partial [Leptospirales bacterium]|nr:spermidine/putrescine ABC transporter substrate-binding protein [Leptospirales bacterium]
MKNFLKIALCVFLLLGFLSCKQSTLSVYNWDNYMDPELIEKFEKEFNCKVELDYYHTNEIAYSTMLDRSRTKKYDIVIISLLRARNLYEQRLLRQLDLEKIPNSRNITRMFVKKSMDGVMRYSVPYLITYAGIAYNKNMVNNFQPTWKMFSRADLIGKVGVLDDMRETVGIALKASGYSYNSGGEVAMRLAEAALMRVRGNMARISYFKELEAELRSGDLYLIMDYGGDAVKLMKENSNIDFVIPEEGSLIVTDSF